MNKGDIVRVEITDMTDDGRGVGHFRGMTVFVSGAVYGDIVDAEITKVKKRFSEAEASKLVSVSPYRINSPNSVYHIESADSEGGEANETGENKICRYVDECGGCAYGKLTRECENELKERYVREKLSRIGGVENPNVLPIVDPSASAPTNPTASATSNPTASRQNYTGLNYRNKAVMAVSLSDEGKPVIGFRPRKSHKVIDCDNCMIQMPPAMAVANRVREYIEENPSSFISDGNIAIKEIVVKTAVSTGDIMVIFYTFDDLEFDESWGNLIYYLDEDPSYSLESVYIYNRKPICIAGRRTIEDELCGLKFEISPESFYQVNPVVAERLYEKALEYAGRGKILDIYCGVGAIGLIAAKRGAKRVVGVESVKAAVLDANRNATINGITNATFVCGLAEEVLPRVIEDEEIQPGVMAEETDGDWTIIVDPPRKGLDSDVVETLSEYRPKRIVYVSCDPATLSRDIKLLAEGGYNLIECAPFNLFPRTSHVECVALMSRTDGRCNPDVL